MRSISVRAFSILAGAGLAVAFAATPAMADGNTFDLTAGSATAYGTYDMMMSIPERPVPPVAVDGTLAVDSRHRCAVVQIARNGPADGIEWHTVTSLCRPGKTGFRARSGLLWGGAKPELRLCVGTTLKRAERGHTCATHTPPADA